MKKVIILSLLIISTTSFAILNIITNKTNNRAYLHLSNIEAFNKNSNNKKFVKIYYMTLIASEDEDLNITAFINERVNSLFNNRKNFNLEITNYKIDQVVIMGFKKRPKKISYISHTDILTAIHSITSSTSVEIIPFDIKNTAAAVICKNDYEEIILRAN